MGALDGAVVGRVGCDVGGPGTNSCTCCNNGRRANSVAGSASSCVVDAGISMLSTRFAPLQRTPYHADVCPRHHAGGDAAVVTYDALVDVLAQASVPSHSHGRVCSAGTWPASAHSALPSCCNMATVAGATVPAGEGATVDDALHGNGRFKTTIVEPDETEMAIITTRKTIVI